MKQLNLGGSGLMASEIALGCMRMDNVPLETSVKVLETAREQGVNFFDNADIYGGGKSEEMFAKAANLAGWRREDMRIQTKCGIRPGVCFDFSREHILEAVEGSLRRLNTDYIDVLLLHRPDTLMEPEEVAEAFDRLHAAGKVRFFGVSNQNPYQMELLQKYIQDKLIVNQLQFGLAHTGMIDQGFHVNMRDEASVDHDGEILDYCRLKNITIQPWSPYQSSRYGGVFLGHDKYPELNRELRDMAKEKGVTPNALATAWILRHPAHMQPIVGTTNPERLADLCTAEEVAMTREEWYRLYFAAGNQNP